MASTETMVSFLVSRKFGSTAILAPAMASFDKAPNSENMKKVAKIEEYQRTLRNAPSNELLSLYNEELAKQEKERFYNQRYAVADFVHWSKAAHWTVDEAIALSFGKEPEVVTWKKIEQLKNETVFAKTFAKRRDLALRATRWKKFGDTMPPVIFINWAKEINIELPNALIEEVTKIGGTAINWHEQYLKLKADYDVLAAQPTNTQKPESTRKSNNVLQAFTAIAIDAYGYDPKAEKSTAPQDVANALDKLGAVGNAKTIRSWLKEGAELLPSNPHKI
ncbi:MAG: hypothetical protein ABIP37_05750 [Methylotenera sp.]